MTVDVLFIDSSHFRDNTFRELELFTPWVRDGGVVLMHDTTFKHLWNDFHSGREEIADVRGGIEDFITKNQQWQFEELLPEGQIPFDDCGLGKLTRRK